MGDLEAAAQPDEAQEDGECATCGEVDDAENECPKAQRPCGHHCNHVWTHDACCWCGTTFGEEPDAGKESK